MLTKTEELIEAVAYASEYDLSWWEAFDSRRQAINVIRKTLREKRDEREIAEFLSYVDVSDLFEDYTAEEIYEIKLREMKEELEETR